MLDRNLRGLQAASVAQDGSSLDTAYSLSSYFYKLSEQERENSRSNEQIKRTGIVRVNVILRRLRLTLVAAEKR